MPFLMSVRRWKVLTLYAGYIAFNTLGVAGLKRIVMEIHEGTAGRGEWRGDNMMLEPIRHAHVLHGRGVFSKHALLSVSFSLFFFVFV